MSAGPEDESFEMVMPLVTVTSRGGPHEDSAYACGWEMGALDAELTHRRPQVLELTIHTVNSTQADLIGMKHGYQSTVSARDHEWSLLVLTHLEQT